MNDEAYNARMAATVSRGRAEREAGAVAENGFIPLGALTKPNGNGNGNGNGHHAAESKPELGEPVAGD